MAEFAYAQVSGFALQIIGPSKVAKKSSKLHFWWKTKIVDSRINLKKKKKQQTIEKMWN